MFETEMVGEREEERLSGNSHPVPLSSLPQVPLVQAERLKHIWYTPCERELKVLEFCVKPHVHNGLGPFPVPFPPGRPTDRTGRVQTSLNL